MPRLVFKHKSRWLINLFGLHLSVFIWKTCENLENFLKSFMCAATVWKTEMGYAPIWTAFNNMSLNALYNKDKSSSTDLNYQWYVYNDLKKFNYLQTEAWYLSKKALIVITTSTVSCGCGPILSLASSVVFPITPVWFTLPLKLCACGRMMTS